jgi:hypothetical protein
MTHTRMGIVAEQRTEGWPMGNAFRHPEMGYPMRRTMAFNARNRGKTVLSYIMFCHPSHTVSLIEIILLTMPQVFPIRSPNYSRKRKCQGQSGF